MDDEFGLTQDCVEWIDENAAPLIQTPAQQVKKKDYSPNQEIEELWKLLGTPSEQISQSLQRSNSVPLPQRQHRRKPPNNGDRKRKRPMSADGENQENILPKDICENNQPLSAGFEELLRKLDAPVEMPTTTIQKLSQSRSKVPFKCQKTPTTHSTRMTAEQRSIDAEKSYSLPMISDRKILKEKCGSLRPTAVQTLSNTSKQSTTSLPPKALTTTTTEPNFMEIQAKRVHVPCQRNQSKDILMSLPIRNTRIVNEFYDDFDLCESDLAALDAAVLSQTEVKSRIQSESIDCNTESISTKEKLEGVSASNSKERFSDDEFEDFNFDFDHLDAQIQQKLTTTTSRPPRESFGDPFGDDFDFSELDKKIAVEHPDDEIKSSFQIDVSSLQIPPIDAKVANQLVSSQGPYEPATSFSRYEVVTVLNDIRTFTQAVLLKSWYRNPSHVDMMKATLHHPFTSKKTSNPKDDETSGEGWIFLRGEWYHTSIESGDSLNICSLSGRYKTDLDAFPIILHTNPPPGSDVHDDLFLVLHPDTLVPPTLVSETVSCSRRAVLRWRLGSTGISSKAALYGTMRHLLFQKCMNHQDFSIKFAKDSVLEVVRKNAENLVALGIRESEAQKEVIRILPQLQRFRKDFFDVQRTINNASTLDGNGVHPDQKLIVRSVQGIEEHLVSQEFGLKGNVDVTVCATTQDALSPFTKKLPEPETNIVGIELKTGHNQNPQNAHMAQLALYTLMLSVQYGKASVDQHPCQSGMLLYMNPEGTRAIRVSPLIQELKSLIGQRNVLSCEMRKVSSPRGVKILYEDESEDENLVCFIIEPAPSAVLPELLSGPQACNRCYSNRECMLYAVAGLTTQPQNATQPFKTTHSKLLSHFCGHLDDEDLRYFNEWDRLIDLEADATAKTVSTSWLHHSLDLEMLNGKGVSSLVLEEHFASSDMKEDGAEWVTISLHRSPDSQSKEAFSNLSLERGCLVVVSVDASSLDASSEVIRRGKIHERRRAMHIARGSIQSIEDLRIVVRISAQEYRQLSREVQSARTRRETLKLRLDRDDVQAGLGTTRQNLINLFTGDVKPFENSNADVRLSQNHFRRNRYERLRNAVVKMGPPQFDSNKCNKMFEGIDSLIIPGCSTKSLKRDFNLLNDDQRNAARKIFSAMDYALVQGLPGTGKSSTIVFLARLLAAHGKRVLITSYTHAAVDNLMMKLIEGGVSFVSNSDMNARIVRIGKKDTSHPAVHPVLLSEVAQQRTIDGSKSSPSSDSLQLILSEARIVGITALSIPRSSVLVGQEFDVVIVDEAGQINQPTIIGALMSADLFVLVGDHKQLPPLVTSEVAEKAGFGVSMLSRLAEKHPECVSQLTLQYRMHEDICRICNEIAYAGKLKCADETVKSKALALPVYCESDSWVSRVINPARPVVFVDTDFFDRDLNQSVVTPLVSLERRFEKGGNGNMVNDREVSIVGRLISELINSGLLASSIGVISPFRAQVRQLDDYEAIARWKSSGLEISTIDRFQGRDKPVIIISFVRSNNKGYSGRLLNDFRRLNVAVSRAMCKLILIGSFTTLHSGSDVLRPVLEGFVARKQIEKIPEHILRSQSVLM